MNLQLKHGKLLTRILPVLVWVCASAVVVVLFQHQSERIHLKGIAYSYEQIINTTETGYLRSVPVQLYQQVKQGDTLAIIKENTVAREEYIDALLQAQRETAEAELEQLKAELAAAEDRLLFEAFEQDNDITTMQRRLAVDLERARIQVLEMTSVLEPDRLTLKDLEVEIEIVKQLLNERATEEYELQRIQAQYDILKEKVNRNEQLLAQAQEDYEAAQLRKDEFEQRLPVAPRLSDKELAPIRQAILVQEKKINELIKQRGIIVLTAPFDGIINTLNYKSGQTVVRGDAIMTIIKPTAETITTWVRQEEMDRYTLNTQVEVVSLNAPYEAFRSQVSNISSSLELIPQRLWRNPTIPEWGRSVQIPIQPDFVCVHNELVGVKVTQ
jgi:multidrug resistance efflux pump